jgi:hypothetical protein
VREVALAQQDVREALASIALAFSYDARDAILAPGAFGALSTPRGGVLFCDLNEVSGGSGEQGALDVRAGEAVRVPRRRLGRARPLDRIAGEG